MYYSFTSLSTVGFGDYYAQDNSERILVTFILLFGVAIFSYIMGKFIEMIEAYKLINADLDDGDELAKFFGLLKKFNHGKNIDENFKNKLEAFFDYRWKYDKNQSIDDDAEKAILDQLPHETQDKLLTKFLYNDFLKSFIGFFRVEKHKCTLLGDNGGAIRGFYTWVDLPYREFMIKIL